MAKAQDTYPVADFLSLFIMQTDLRNGWVHQGHCRPP